MPLITLHITCISELVALSVQILDTYSAIVTD